MSNRNRSQKSGAGIERRTILSGIAAAALTGSIPFAEAQHVHQAADAHAATYGGVYKPKALTQHEFDTLRALAEIIVPGTTRGGCAEFVDTLSAQNNELLAIFSGGLLWLDNAMLKSHEANFLKAIPELQRSMCDVLAWRKNETPTNAAGIRFFVWARRMAVDAYYTSPVGIKELGYMGNKGMKEFHVPQEAIDWAIKRSPFNAG